MITVSTVAALLAAVHSAHGGEVIALAPGDYTAPSIAHVNFDRPVTITSADPRRPAVLHGLKIGASSGLVVSDLELSTLDSGDPWYAFRVVGDNLTFQRLRVHGDATAPHPWKQLNGFYVNHSTNIVFKDCSFDHLAAGISANYNEHMQIVDNDFAVMNKGGIEMGGTSDVLIAKNTFHDFDTAPGGHGDALQIFTWGTKDSAHDITVTGNAYWRGAGVAAQVYFIQDETHKIPFHNVTVTDNLALGGLWNSIMISNATGKVVVADNVLASWTGYDVVKGGPTDFAAWIRLVLVDKADVRIWGNRAQQYVSNQGPVPVPRENSTMKLPDDRGEQLRKEWLSAHGLRDRAVAK